MEGGREGDPWEPRVLRLQLSWLLPGTLLSLHLRPLACWGCWCAGLAPQPHPVSFLPGVVPRDLQSGASYRPGLPFISLNVFRFFSLFLVSWSFTAMCLGRAAFFYCVGRSGSPFSLEVHAFQLWQVFPYYFFDNFPLLFFKCVLLLELLLIRCRISSLIFYFWHFF